MSGERGQKVRRSYRPAVEALEALKLLSAVATPMPGPAVIGDLHPGLATPIADPPATGAASETAWDEALTQTRVADLFGPSVSPATAAPALSTTGATAASASDTAAGLSQLDRYLGRAWARAGVPAQLHDDATQAVYVSLLQNLGRSRFDSLVGEVGRVGVREVLSRETADGPDFFRAIDTVKKRAQREKTYQPIDALDVASAGNGEDARSLWRGALQEAIDQSLTPREASLVHDTLMGKTPAEIAQQWGVAPKTVSNEKTRVIQKLRDALVSDLAD